MMANLLHHCCFGAHGLHKSRSGNYWASLRLAGPGLLAGTCRAGALSSASSSQSCSWPGDSVSRLHSALGGEPRIQLPVAHRQRLLVLGQRLVALALQIEHAAKIDMRPGKQAQFFAGCNGFLKVVDVLAWLSGCPVIRSTRARMK